mmetsp:Transcript_11299/g.28590  ORF Transcript_11299/g.28590 Transcript_11299/m.28590 type:complete len:230 (-) Transcript_11299:2652-3341(-)
MALSAGGSGCSASSPAACSLCLSWCTFNIERSPWPIGFVGTPGRTSERSWMFCKAPAACASKPGDSPLRTIATSKPTAGVCSAMAALHAGESAALRSSMHRLAHSSTSSVSISAESATSGCSPPACASAFARVIGRSASASTSTASGSSCCFSSAERASANVAQLASAPATDALALIDSCGCPSVSATTNAPRPVRLPVRLPVPPVPPAAGAFAGGSTVVSSSASTQGA